MASRLSRQTAPAPSWGIGTYLTDGRRLFWVIAVDGEMLELEDCSTERVECWAMRQAVARLDEVEACLTG